ncbi:MAG: crossover junction endodeoxyribonuclease RuvC [Bacteroidales bacterium]|jgi:crossover junction endodeoxyribonuclease RuvC|nr:crossover junction endodeoxyribonuclease RuvC [Bacteroidales bacterium]
MQTKEQIILGIDPGTNIMGYGVIQIKNNSISVLKMNVLKLDKQKTHIERLKDIFEGVTAIIEENHPDSVAIEEPFYGKNIQSMLKLGRAQGVAIAAAMHNNIPVYEYSPRKVKLAITGKGSASKEQLAAMLHHLAEFKEEHACLDATDAVGIAICHYLQCKYPSNEKSYSNWKTFLTKNSDRIIPQ